MKIPPPTVGAGNHRLDPDVLRKHLDEGMTLLEVGKIYGVTKQRISQLVGPTLTPRGRRAVERAKVVRNLPTIKKMVEEGIPLTTIAKNFNLSVSAVNSLVKVREVRKLKCETHGTVACYQYGPCRCDECKKANAIRLLTYRNRNKGD